MKDFICPYYRTVVKDPSTALKRTEAIAKCDLELEYRSATGNFSYIQILARAILELSDAIHNLKIDLAELRSRKNDRI